MPASKGDGSRHSVKYQCIVCDEFISSKGLCKRHLNEQHVSSTQYRCEECAETFFVKTAAKEHVQGCGRAVCYIVCKQQDKRTYACEFTGNLFTSMSTYLEHLLKLSEKVGKERPSGNSLRKLQSLIDQPCLKPYVEEISQRLYHSPSAWRSLQWDGVQLTTIIEELEHMVCRDGTIHFSEFRRHSVQRYLEDMFGDGTLPQKQPRLSHETVQGTVTALASPSRDRLPGAQDPDFANHLGVDRDDSNVALPVVYTILDSGSDRNSDAETESSHAESVFSTPSIASSITSTGAATPSDETIRVFVKSLFCTEELSPVHAAAVQDSAIGIERHKRNVRRMISNYGTALRRESETKAHRVIASLLRSRPISERAAREILDQSCPVQTIRTIAKDHTLSTNESPATPTSEDHDQGYQSDESVYSDDEDESDTGFETGELHKVKDFLRRSQAYSQFKAQLIDFAHRPYQQRIWRSLLTRFPSTDGMLPQGVTKANGGEISWVPTRLFQFLNSEELSIFDHLKAGAEDMMGETWDWRPLQPRKHPVPLGFVRMKWRTFSKFAMRGAPLAVDFPPDTESDYDFHRPLRLRPPFGPICKDEFRDRFYTFCEDCCHSWHRHQMLRWPPGLLDEEAVKFFPKRKMALEMEDGKREYFWGLQVRERRSGTVVFAYICFFNLPGTIFFFLWLFYWGHASDLQNASVPPLASLSMTLGFVGWLFQNRDAVTR
ncbi:uncharacterized protein LTR77_010028 [Saxophila tyrrhenica]|uniref:C2H2-type domain-containing protein n=1 Tax=Saxophila tyrrhenica TaxID=1690608 RepID=A0AAV9P042_9PEZI|nr:hypothetical protein LTR77_010028 [Saxophila tyrrhenica]